MELFILFLVAAPLLVGLAQYALLNYTFQLWDGLGALHPLFLLLRLNWLLLTLAPALVLVRDAYLGYSAPGPVVLLTVLALLTLLVFHASRYVLFAYSPLTNQVAVVLIGFLGTLLFTAWYSPGLLPSNVPLIEGTPLQFVAISFFLVIVLGTWVQRLARNRARDLYLSKSSAKSTS